MYLYGNPIIRHTCLKIKFKCGIKYSVRAFAQPDNVYKVERVYSMFVEIQHLSYIIGCILLNYVFPFSCIAIPWHIPGANLFSPCFFDDIRRLVNRIVGNEQEEWFVGMPVNEVYGFAGDGIGEVLFFLNGLAPSHDRIIGIVVGLVAQVSRVDHLAEPPYAFSSARQDFPS